MQTAMTEIVYEIPHATHQKIIATGLAEIMVDWSIPHTTHKQIWGAIIKIPLSAAVVGLLEVATSPIQMLVVIG